MLEHCTRKLLDERMSLGRIVFALGLECRLDPDVGEHPVWVEGVTRTVISKADVAFGVVYKLHELAAVLCDMQHAHGCRSVFVIMRCKEGEARPIGHDPDRDVCITKLIGHKLVASLHNSGCE